ncbi:MAG TPA: hypothetical protein DCP49_00425 [Erysipelotrichaceae bacterium]|nr:hypothetical protein [Erysipelotrichaceae bacterium]
MVGKLLKYNLISEGKLCGSYCLLTLACAAAYRLFGLGSNAFFSIMQKGLLIVLVVLVIGSILVPVVEGWVHYNRHVYKDEGYLTNTLPVSKGAIYWSEWLSGALCLFVCLACAVFSLWLVVYFEDPQWMQATLSGLAGQLHITHPAGIAVLIGITYYTQVLFVMTCGFAGMTIGHYFDKDKTAKSILFSLLMYIAGILIILGMVFLIGRFDPGLMEILNSDVIPDVSVFRLFVGFACGSYIVCAILLDLISIKVMNKGMELE